MDMVMEESDVSETPHIKIRNDQIKMWGMCDFELKCLHLAFVGPQ